MKTNVQATTIWAYLALKDLGARQQAVYRVLWEKGPLSNLQIADALGLPQNSITGRTMELRERGLVREAYKDKSPVTKKTVIFWEIAE